MIHWLTGMLVMGLAGPAEDAESVEAAAPADASAPEAAPASPAPQPESGPPPAPPGPPASVEQPPDGASPAVGGRGMTPLPPPPPAEPIKSLDSGPWRGTFWFGARLEVIGPVAGKRPGRAEVVTVGGALELGWRIRNYLSLRTSMSLAVHDAQTREIEDIYGGRQTTVDYGEILGFELFGLRAYLPVNGRFQPYLDGSAGLALWFPASGANSEVGGLFRGGLGFDGWVTTNFTLGMDGGYRVFVLSDSTGHFLTLGGHFGLHW